MANAPTTHIARTQTLNVFHHLTQRINALFGKAECPHWTEYLRKTR